MDIPVARVPSGRVRERTPHVDAAIAGPAGAYAVLLGAAISTVGISWDIEWHRDVGPDTFFTLPHLVLYCGSALAGIASLAMVLLSTSMQRAGRPVPPSMGGTSVRVFGGIFTAPLGYLVSGVGAASFLIYGLLDLVWHSIYGFDAVLSTPSHVALFLSISITMIGTVIVFAGAREQRWGRIGVVLAIPILMLFAPIPVNALNNFTLPVNPVVVGIVLFSPLLWLIGAGVLQRAGATVAIAVTLGTLQAALWWFSPWAAKVYATSAGLPLRDGLIPSPPKLPSGAPMFLIVAAVAVEVLFWLSRTRGLDARKMMLLAGVLTGLIVGLTLPVQQSITDPTTPLSSTDVVILGLLGMPLGALAGFLAARFTVMLHALAPA
ncbi:MAG TPA: hypothetical protein VNY55_16920 [Mycobacterium sp.]|nr:hypothetical protein [Mycobacterium sp.]